MKQGRDRKKVDLQRDFTVASPAEFVTRFGGNKVIEKASFNFSCFEMMMMLSQGAHADFPHSPANQWGFATGESCYLASKIVTFPVEITGTSVIAHSGTNQLVFKEQ